MSTCPNCHEEIEDGFEICWNCCYSLTENRVIDCEKELDANTELEELEVKTRKIDCLRCHIDLHYSGVYRFHEGARYGALGNFFELFVNQECFEIYVCSKCGKVEFYIPLAPDKCSIRQREAIETEEPS